MPDDKSAADALGTNDIDARERWREGIRATTTVSNPKLWSHESPNLYRAVHEDRPRSTRVSDLCDTTFGIRTINFDADKGFFLNGKPSCSRARAITRTTPASAAPSPIGCNYCGSRG